MRALPVDMLQWKDGSGFIPLGPKKLQITFPQCPEISQRAECLQQILHTID